MAYSAEISRSNPTCFLFVIDQSGSMGDTFGGEIAARKADFVADVMNRTLHDLVIRCTRTEEVRNYCHISVIGYGGSVGPVLAGSLTGRDLVPIAELADNPARIETRTKKIADGAGGLVDTQVRFPVWLEPTVGGGTPMCQALGMTQQIAERWVSDHPGGFPPTILHLTDGESTDGDPTEIGKRIMSLKTSDGEVLLYSCHVSATRSAKVEFPDNDSSLADNFAKMLFSISSKLPEPFLHAARQIGLNTGEGARGFVFNGDAASVVQFFEIGTRPANMR
jgi:hypothetical protein